MMVAAVTTSERAAAVPDNVPLVAGIANRDRDCTVNVSQLITVDRADLEESVGLLDARTVRRVDDGLRLVLSLGLRPLGARVRCR